MKPVSTLSQQQLQAVLRPSLEFMCCSVGECGNNIHFLKVFLLYIYSFLNSALVWFVFFTKKAVLANLLPGTATVLYNCIC